MPAEMLGRHWRKIAALAVAAAVAVLSVGYLVHVTGGISGAMARVKALAEILSKMHPAMYVLAVAILPYVGVPSSFLYPLGGNAYGLFGGLCWTALGLALNLPLGYFLGRRWLRGPISRWLERRGRRLPEVPAGELGKLVVLTRVIPGPPLIAQNFLLALAGVPFGMYFVYSLPICVLFAAGILLAGQGLLQGNTKAFIAGACTVIALALLAHVVKSMYQASRKP